MAAEAAVRFELSWTDDLDNHDQQILCNDEEEEDGTWKDEVAVEEGNQDVHNDDYSHILVPCEDPEYSLEDKVVAAAVAAIYAAGSIRGTSFGVERAEDYTVPRDDQE